jgi:hypothetical protein
MAPHIQLWPNIRVSATRSLRPGAGVFTVGRFSGSGLRTPRGLGSMAIPWVVARSMWFRPRQRLCGSLPLQVCRIPRVRGHRTLRPPCRSGRDGRVGAWSSSRRPRSTLRHVAATTVFDNEPTIGPTLRRGSALACVEIRSSRGSSPAVRDTIANGGVSPPQFTQFVQGEPPGARPMAVARARNPSPCTPDDAPRPSRRSIGPLHQRARHSGTPCRTIQSRFQIRESRGMFISSTHLTQPIRSA